MKIENLNVANNYQHMMKHTFFALIILTTLSGCATTQSFKTEMNQYVGLSSAALSKKMGQPLAEYHRDDRTILVYRPVIFELPIPIPIMTALPSGNYGGGYKVNMSSAKQTIRNNCQVHFVLSHDIVQSWQAIGKECPHR